MPVGPIEMAPVSFCASWFSSLDRDFINCIGLFKELPLVLFHFLYFFSDSTYLSTSPLHISWQGLMWPGWPQIHYIAAAGIELLILMSPPSMWHGITCEPPHLVWDSRVSLCSPDYLGTHYIPKLASNTQQFFCLSFQNTGISSMHHHTWLRFSSYYSFLLSVLGS